MFYPGFAFYSTTKHMFYALYSEINVLTTAV